MEAINNKQYSDLIYRFMDGDTDSVQQTVLFNQLSKDAELQNEFQQAVAVAKGFNIDKPVLSPPAHLTNNLFMNAGFTAPIAGVSKYGTGFLSIMKKMSIPLMYAAAGALITVLVFLGLNNNQDIMLNNSMITSSGEYIAMEPAPTVPVIKSEETLIVKKESNTSKNNIFLMGNNNSNKAFADGSCTPVSIYKPCDYNKRLSVNNPTTS